MGVKIADMSTLERSQLGNLVRSIDGAFASATRWSLAFGTLLKLVRDKTLDLEDDVDVVVWDTDPKVVISSCSTTWMPREKVVRDDNGETLKQIFMCELPSGKRLSIDVYFLVRSGSYLWHCFDEFKENPKGGALSKYVFRGFPAEIFDVSPKTVEAINKDPAYEWAMRKNGTWNRLIPGLESEGVALSSMYGYGHFLDIAYPNWALRQDKTKFSNSRTEWIKVVKSCKHLNKAPTTRDDDYQNLMEKVRTLYRG